MNKIENTQNVETDDTINIRAEIEKYLMHWKWFVIGLMLALIGAFLYLRYATPKYKASALILIEEEQKGGASAELAAFGSLGMLGGGGQGIDNELEIIKSRKIFGEVIKNLDLNISYFIEGRIKDSELYQEKLPIKMEFLNKNSQYYKLDTVFTIVINSKTEFNLISDSGKETQRYAFGDQIQSDLGSFKILKKNLKEKTNTSTTIKVVIKPLQELIDTYKKDVSVSPVNKKSSVVALSLDDAVRLKAEHFLDSLVSSYNRDAILGKNLVSEKTKIFIDDRLKLVKNDFDNINIELKDYKTSNKVTNIGVESELVIKSIDDVRGKIIASNIELILIKSLYEELVKNSTENTLLPPNLGLGDISVSTSILEYNQLVQNKVRLLRSASELNPTVINLTGQIEGVKSSLLKSLENSQKGLELTLEELNKEDRKIKAKISGIPIQELELGKIKLQQGITSGLYSFLLKKKEETAISLAITVANAKVIDRAYASEKPISPKKSMIYLAALLLGVLIPFIIVYLKNLFDTKLHTKTDLDEMVSIPFLGDVPRSETKEKIVIHSDARSSTAEAFRLIRTNLDFMLASNKEKCKTIFITSTTSGEGKSFISVNTAATLALSGKKVLLMGMDLRAPKITEYLGIPDKKGVTNYITNSDLEVDDLVFNIDEVNGLDIISSGVIPPNPAELLMTKRIENLFTTIKEKYDYIIVDTAPVSLVTDTMLIAKHADMFIYIARANYLDKRLLTVPQNLYRDKRLPNMAMLLNDTDPKRSYGYGYGGYGYGVVVEKPWYKKIFDRS